MKSTIKTGMVLAAFLVYMGYGIYGDYTWGDRIVEEYKTAGWTLVYEQDNYASITSPWTLIIAPVTGYWFVREDSIGRYEKGKEIYLAMVANVRYDYTDITKEYTIDFIDAINKRTAIATMDEVKEKQLDHLQWEKNWYAYEEGQPGHAIMTHVLKQVQ